MEDALYEIESMRRFAGIERTNDSGRDRHLEVPPSVGAARPLRQHARGGEPASQPAWIDASLGRLSQSNANLRPVVGVVIVLVIKQCAAVLGEPFDEGALRAPSLTIHATR
jgi:hypothetical protein